MNYHEIRPADRQIEHVDAFEESIVESVEKPGGVGSLIAGEHLEHIQVDVGRQAEAFAIAAGDETAHERAVPDPIVRIVLVGPVDSFAHVLEVRMRGLETRVEHGHSHVRSAHARLVPELARAQLVDELASRNGTKYPTVFAVLFRLQFLLFLFLFGSRLGRRRFQLLFLDFQQLVVVFVIVIRRLVLTTIVSVAVIYQSPSYFTVFEDAANEPGGICTSC